MRHTELNAAEKSVSRGSEDGYHPFPSSSVHFYVVTTTPDHYFLLEMCALKVQPEVEIKGLELIPDTPAGEQARWRLTHFYLRDEYLTPETVLEHFVIPGFARTAEEFIDVRRGKGPGPFEIVEVNAPNDLEIEVRFVNESAKKFRWWVSVEEAPPHRMRTGSWGRLSKDGLTTRFAVPEDASALTELDLRSPIVLGDLNLIYDRGDKWFDWTRLMEHVTIAVAELDGQIVGVSCGADHTIIIGGIQYHGYLGVHLRVAPEHQKAGVYPAMMQQLQRKGVQPKGTPCSYGYIARDNAAMQYAWRQHPKWSISPLRGLIACSDFRGPASGRPATPADASRIVEILNTCHSKEEMFTPYTVESLTARLERAPDLYSWSNLTIGEGSVLGVWPAGLKVIRERNGKRTESVRALVLDHGFVPNSDRAEKEFESLLSSGCGWLADDRTTELSIFTSVSSPNYETVSRMSARMDEFDLCTFNVPEPETAKENGLYVDQIYF